MFEKLDFIFVMLVKSVSDFLANYTGKQITSKQRPNKHNHQHTLLFHINRRVISPCPCAAVWDISWRGDMTNMLAIEIESEPNPLSELQLLRV